MVNVAQGTYTDKSGFRWENAGRVAEVRREGASEVCEASGAGRRWITVTDHAKGLKVSAAVDAAGVSWKYFRVKDNGNGGLLVSTSRTKDHEHLFCRVLQSLSAIGRV